MGNEWREPSWRWGREKKGALAKKKKKKVSYLTLPLLQHQPSESALERQRGDLERQA